MKKALLGVSALAVLGAIALPAVSLAATYAYVNTAGEVMTTESTSWETAIQTAPSIAARSGVMLIEVTDDEVLDETVPGV
jgi:acid phosphatase class B